MGTALADDVAQIEIARRLAKGYSAQHEKGFPLLLVKYMDVGAAMIGPDDWEGAAADATAIRATGRDQSTQIMLAAAYECITLLVGTELDTVTPGERGLGRMSALTDPRLGGQFRSAINGTVGKRLGSCLERAVVAGVAAAALNNVIRDDPREIRLRPVERLFVKWGSEIAYAPDRIADHILNIAQTMADDTIDEIRQVAKDAGMIGGFRAKKQAVALDRTVLFCISAGVSLFVFCSSFADPQFNDA